MDVKASLMGSIDEILDKMTFMFFEEVEEPHTGDEFQFITQVRMRGVIQGTLNLLVTEDTAKYIARNLIGIRDDDELFEDTLGDALGDVLVLSPKRSEAASGGFSPGEEVTIGWQEDSVLSLDDG